MTEHTDVLVVGGSVAGLRTAESLRRFGYGGRITVLESGGELPCDRTALSKQVLSGASGPESVMLRRQEDLDKARIDFRLRTRAVALDSAAHRVETADGQAIGYATLVIATGAAARRLPGDGVPGVHHLRTLPDALALREAAGPASRVVIVGAGFIGAEVASVLVGSVASVTVVEPFAFPLSRVLGDTVGARLARLHEARGVRLVLGHAVASIRDSADGEREVTLDDGRVLTADLVVVGIGAVPNTGWLAGSGVEIADGVVLDEFCRAQAPDVYAVGDVARWFNPAAGEWMRVEHWTNAVEQSAVVAANIISPASPRSFSSVPYVWSDQYGNRLQVIGRPRPGDTLVPALDDPAALRFAALYVRDGLVAGAYLQNAPALAMPLRRAILAGGQADAVLATLPAGSATAGSAPVRAASAQSASA